MNKIFIMFYFADSVLSCICIDVLKFFFAAWFTSNAEVIIVNNGGKPRLMRFYEDIGVDEQQKLLSLCPWDRLRSLRRILIRSASWLWNA